VARAQIAQGTFYLYFPSKLALMPAIAEGFIIDDTVAIDRTHFEARDQAPSKQEKLSQSLKSVVVNQKKNVISG